MNVFQRAVLNCVFQAVYDFVIEKDVGFCF